MAHNTNTKWLVDLRADLRAHHNNLPEQEPVHITKNPDPKDPNKGMIPSNWPFNCLCTIWKIRIDQAELAHESIGHPPKFAAPHVHG